MRLLRRKTGAWLLRACNALKHHGKHRLKEKNPPLVGRVEEVGIIPISAFKAKR